MNFRHAVPRIAAVLALAALPAAGALAAPQKDGDAILARLYQVHYLQVDEARLLLRQECLKLSNNECETRTPSRKFLELFTDAKTHEALESVLKRKDVPPPTQVFQVTLLVADNGATGSAPDLPPGARQALDDLRTLLPMRSFRLLDTGYIRTSREAELGLGGDLGYMARLHFEGDPTADRPIFIDRFQLSQTFSRPINPIPGQASSEEVRRPIVSSSFAMEVGETVVVGTSKLNGGEEALVVLLTAVKE